MLTKHFWNRTIIFGIFGLLWGGVLVAGMFVEPVFAQPIDHPEGPQGAQEVIDIIEDVADWLFAGLMTGAAIAVLWAAYTFLASGGNPEGAVKGRNILLWAAVGVIIAVFARVFDDILRNVIL